MSWRGRTWLLLAALPLLPGLLSAQTAADADALFERASELYGKGSFAEVIPVLERAAGIDESLGKARIPDLAYDRKYLGYCSANVGRHDDAADQLGKALALFASLGASDEQGEILGQLEQLGLQEYYRAGYDAAERYFRTELEAARAGRIAAWIGPALNNLGMVRSARGSYEEALELYRQASDEHERTGNKAAAAQTLGNTASVYLSMSRFAEAEQSYQGALAAFERLGDDANAANTRINLGMLHTSLERYDLARAELEQGLARAGQLGLRQSEAYGQASLGSVHYATGRYDLAEAAYLRALEIDESLGLALLVIDASSKLGMVYQSWGRYDLALRWYRASLDSAQRIGVPDQEMIARRLIGSALASQGSYDLALREYDLALAMAERMGREGEQLADLDAMGSAHFLLRDFAKAEQLYRAALALADKLQQKAGTGRELIHLGNVMKMAGNRSSALARYSQAADICREAGSRIDEATARNNLGALFLEMKAYPQAEAQLLMAIAIKEQLRATASGENRMDFLASQISSYRLLVAARVRRGDPLGAFGASEMIKARWLAEQLGDGEAAATDDIHPAQAGLGPGVLVLSFANVDTEQPVLISASRTTVRARELGDSQEELAPATSSAGDVPARSEQPPARGFLIVRTAPPAAGMAEPIAAYRRLLGIPAPTPEERAGRRDFAKALYDFLIGPIEEELRDKDELLILPEGSLCSLPFETLVMPDGRYLVERFHVTYAPSLAVRRLLARQTTSAVGARPLLALGGALYGGAGGPARDAPRISDQQLASLRVDAARLLDTKRSTRELYATLGLDSWDELPGTLAEVNSIGALMPRGIVLTGADASELRVKQMSRSGELARFGVIHFATHGLAVPEAPELSALVLSLGRSEGDEDGFLTTREITELRLNADFVNLSACQTGMGKILAGEGIVGLSHAFLSAGARGLSVSLWPVSDDATRQFMVDLYQGVQERGLSFARAMTEVKRAFIRAGRWREPYYWAPFVYYGN